MGNIGIDSSSSPHSVHFQLDDSIKSHDSTGVGEGLPPRPPPSTKSKEKSPKSVAAGLEQQYSPARSHTPSSSSGHHSGGSKLSVMSTPTPSGSPSSMSGCVAHVIPTITVSDRTISPIASSVIAATSGSVMSSKQSESTILRLRREVEALKNAFASSQKRWSDVSFEHLGVLKS